MDQSMVSDYPFVNYQELPAEEILVKYPMTGGKSHHVTVGVHDVAKNKTVYLKTGTPADQYLTNIAWSPDNKEVYVAIVNRDQNHMWLQAYDARTGNHLRLGYEDSRPWLELGADNISSVRFPAVGTASSFYRVTREP